ncbi:CPBP family intramembrane glutamic endopeptidase [Nocardiopsis alborubida]|uniref:CPBP family intramembrane metalloprotease n=1 Tax=Nocardiopsis alborubida TaxID=146802 RepID=A0A7X6MG95_9ACTN|nr:type II CAAX endopeptidase family protein [Nocardiopsis alborubida]NKZ00723.1 CPBP family intramembrane metalloprotease [Nocardiopsis alborubida]
MRIVWQFLAVAVVALIGGQGLAAVQGNPWLTIAVGVLTAVLSVLAYRWVVRRTEHREVTELSRKGAVAATGLGTLIGIGLFGLVIANIAFLGFYQANGVGSVTGALGLLGFMAAVAVGEEVMWRGVLFRIVEERTGTWIALVLTGVLFGLVHLINPHASLWGAIAIAIEAGGMLTAAYAATRSLWLPIGLHFGWNLAGSAIFSTSVSGTDSQQGLLDTTLSGPMLITGGDFGPEGSLYSILFCTVATIVFMWMAHRRGRLVPLRRRADGVDATAAPSL